MPKLRVLHKALRAIVGPAWNGQLLSHHLRTNRGIELGARQCRRLLRRFGVAPGPRQRDPSPHLAEPIRAPENEPKLNNGKSVGNPVAGLWRKELVLRKIRRLASSGLPVYPFVLTLFDLIGEAVATGDLPQGIQTDPAKALSWVFTNLDQAKWVPILASLSAGYDSTAWPGFRPRNQLNLGTPVMTLEEFTTDDYRRSAFYNEFFHPLGLSRVCSSNSPTRANS